MGFQQKLFSSGEPFMRECFILTKEFRNPKKGEFYLSGAIPQAWQALSDLSTKFHIVRKATEKETKCFACKQTLPIMK